MQFINITNSQMSNTPLLPSSLIVVSNRTEVNSSWKVNCYLHEHLKCSNPTKTLWEDMDSSR